MKWIHRNQKPSRRGQKSSDTFARHADQGLLTLVANGEPINLMDMDMPVNFDFWYCKLSLPTGGDS